MNDTPEVILSRVRLNWIVWRLKSHSPLQSAVRTRRVNHSVP